MTRRFNGNMNGERYLGNSNPSSMEVHDLDNENTNCQIDTIISNGHDKPFTSLETAHQAGYDNGAWCIGDSKR